MFHFIYIYILLLFEEQTDGKKLVVESITFIVFFGAKIIVNMYPKLPEKLFFCDLCVS
jgi:hypothetical protein